MKRTAAFTSSVCSAAGLASVSMRGVSINPQLHLSPNHFSQKVNLVRLRQLTDRHIHLVNNLCIRR